MIQAHGFHKGIKIFGQEARNAMQKEMQQHQDMETYIPVCWFTHNQSEPPDVIAVSTVVTTKASY